MEILKSIHVEFSPAKTHESERFYEFAKRIIYNGVEITPFPISSLRQATKSSDTLVLVIREAIERGWDFVSVSSSVQLYFSIVKEFRSKICKKIALNSLWFNRVIDMTRGIVPA